MVAIIMSFLFPSYTNFTGILTFLQVRKRNGQNLLAMKEVNLHNPAFGKDKKARDSSVKNIVSELTIIKEQVGLMDSSFMYGHSAVRINNCEFSCSRASTCCYCFYLISTVFVPFSWMLSKLQKFLLQCQQQCKHLLLKILTFFLLVAYELFSGVL